MDRTSCDLLHSFLSSQGLVHLLVILNDFVDIVAEDRDPRATMQVAPSPP